MRRGTRAETEERWAKRGDFPSIVSPGRQKVPEGRSHIVYAAGSLAEQTRANETALGPSTRRAERGGQTQGNVGLATCHLHRHLTGEGCSTGQECRAPPLVGKPGGAVAPRLLVLYPSFWCSLGGSGFVTLAARSRRAVPGDVLHVDSSRPVCHRRHCSEMVWSSVLWACQTERNQPRLRRVPHSAQ